MENTGDKLNLGYGRDRSKQDFNKYGVAPIWCYIDTEQTERTQRARMFQVLGVLHDQGHSAELVLMSWGELGHGVDLKRQREKLEAMGITVTVPKEKPKRPRGRPPGSTFDPAPEHDAEIKAAWHDDGRTLQGVINIASGLGYAVTHGKLKYRYGNRFKS